MSTQTIGQRLLKTLDLEVAEPYVEPGAGQAPQAREETITVRKRFELGIFIRKIVDGTIVEEWQLPRFARRPIEPIEQQNAPEEDAGPADSRYGAGTGQSQVQTFALRSTLDGGSDAGGDLEESSTSKGSDDTGPIHETRYEVGLFFGTTSTTADSDSDDS